MHERWLAFHKPDPAIDRPGFWVVRDLISGEGEHELRFLLHFYLGEIRFDEFTGEIVTDYGADRGNVVVGFVNPPGLAFDAERGRTDEPARGWFSPQYGKIFPAWEVAGVRRAALPAIHTMVFVPFRGVRPEVVTAEAANGVRVTIDGRPWDVAF